MRVGPFGRRKVSEDGSSGTLDSASFDALYELIGKRNRGSIIPGRIQECLRSCHRKPLARIIWGLLASQIASEVTITAHTDPKHKLRIIDLLLEADELYHMVVQLHSFKM